MLDYQAKTKIQMPDDNGESLQTAYSQHRLVIMAMARGCDLVAAIPEVKANGIDRLEAIEQRVLEFLRSKEVAYPSEEMSVYRWKYITGQVSEGEIELQTRRSWCD